MYHLYQLDHACTECGYASASSSALKSHIESVHMKVKKYPCDRCPQTFYHAAGMRKHVEAVHERLLRLACPVANCSFRTDYKLALDQHVKSQHDKIKDMKCDNCDYETGSKYLLRQ